MPIFDFLCPNGHLTEKLFLTFGESDKAGEKVECPECDQQAERQIGRPCQAMLYGSPEGYHKPSPTAKRIVNPDSISFEGGKGDYIK